MKQFLVFTLFITVTTQVRGNELPINPFKLTPWSELTQEKQAELSKFRQATFAMDNLDGYSCSGTYVSNEGHILTALHCVRECIWNSLRAKHVREGIDHDEYFYRNAFLKYLNGQDKLMYDADVQGLKGSELTFMQLSPEDFQGLTCQLKINGKAEEVEFLGGGRGHLWPFFSEGLSDKNYVPLWHDMLEQGFGPSGDFALLKQKKQNTPCISLSPNDVREGEKLQNLASTCYKGYIHEKRDGSQVFYSEGKEATKIYQRLDDYNIPQMIISTISAENCSSGSLAIGEDGDVKAVVVQSMSYRDRRVDRNAPSSYLSYAIKSPYILKVLHDHWGIDELKCN